VLKVGVAWANSCMWCWILEANKRVQILKLRESPEPNRAFADGLTQKTMGIPMDWFLILWMKMLAATKPERSTAFGNIFDHSRLWWNACARKRNSVLVEKPLARSMGAWHLNRRTLSYKNTTSTLLNNYETTVSIPVEKAVNS